MLEYKLSMICIETFSDKIAKRILVENSLNYYALVLFSNILTALRDNSEMFDTNTQNEMSSNKKTLNQKILKDYFLPAYKKGIENDTSLASMSQDKREQLYEISKNYGNSKLEQKPKKNTLTEGDFTTIFKYIPRYCPEEKLCVE